MKLRRNRFQRGSGCYTCISCGKKTRETGECESGCELCRECYELAGLENSLSDGAITQEEYDRRVAEIRGEKKEKQKKKCHYAGDCEGGGDDCFGCEYYW